MCLLEKEPRTVTSLCEELDTYQSLISGHLAVLRQAGVVSASRSGYLHIYRVEARAIDLMSERLLELARGGAGGTE